MKKQVKSVDLSQSIKGPHEAEDELDSNDKLYSMEAEIFYLKTQLENMKDMQMQVIRALKQHGIQFTSY